MAHLGDSTAVGWEVSAFRVNLSIKYFQRRKVSPSWKSLAEAIAAMILPELEEKQCLGGVGPSQTPVTFTPDCKGSCPPHDLSP